MNYLSYELAKQLKDAGFPQRIANGPTPHDQYTGYGLGFVYPHEGEQEEAYAPTLSELIGACGDGRFLLEKGFDTAPSGLDVIEHWVAQRGMYKEVGIIPEEAVANLYLALKQAAKKNSY